MNFKYGLKRSIPIGLSYLAVSFAFGVLAIRGVTPLVAAIISFTNLTSLGQFAGMKLIIAGASYIELIGTMLLINLRYLLMSISLTQKLVPNIPMWKKMIFSFGVTDETYAMAIDEKENLTASYMFGLMVLPILGWTTGTILGALGAQIFPEKLVEALNLALYAMFISIIMPELKKSKPVLFVVLVSISLSCIFEYVPYINKIMIGARIILCTIISSILGAILFPIDNVKKEAQDV